MCLDCVGQQLGGDSVQISVRCYHRGDLVKATRELSVFFLTAAGELTIVSK